MKRRILTGMVLLVLAGCAAVPFKETPLAPIASEDPKSLVDRFQAGMSGSFQLLNSVVFEYNSRTVSGIGYVDIDRRDGVFKVVCLNHLGVKLFELSGDRAAVVTHYAIADFSRYGDVAAVVGSDIRRIYFDLLPSPEARIWKRKHKISFRQPDGPGLLEYVFAGVEGDLIEKNYYEDDGIVWRASYYEYREEGGKRFPQGIIFQHYLYGYRLIVRQKELRV